MGMSEKYRNNNKHNNNNSDNPLTSRRTNGGKKQELQIYINYKLSRESSINQLNSKKQ